MKGELVESDEEQGDTLRAIEFPRIKGGKAFDTNAKWFTKLLKDLGQPLGKPVAISHGGDD